MTQVLNRFVAQFVERERQARYLALLGSARRRDDGLWDLLHDGRHLDRRRFSRVPVDELSSVAARLRALGVRGMGYVLAWNDEHDGGSVELDQALSLFLGQARDVVIYFPEANAGYYENHEGEVHIFCARS